MSEFYNLVRIVYRRHQKGKRLLIDFDAPHAPGSVLGKDQQLIELVLERPQVTDLELTKLLYGTNSVANRGAFRQLRARVQEKLLNNLPFLDYSESGPVSRPYEQECRTLLFRALVLISEGESRISMRLLLRCLKRALEGEFTDQAEQAATHLAVLYADTQQVEQYERLTRQLRDIRTRLELEHRSEEVYTRVRLLAGGGVGQRRRALPTGDEDLRVLAELHQQAQTFTTFNNLYRSRISYAEFSGHYDEVLVITRAAQQQYDEGRINAQRFDLRYNYFWLVYAHLRTGQLTEGIQLAERYASAFNSESTNWFFFYEAFFLLALHAQRYELVRQLLQKVRANPAFPKLRSAAQERWEMFTTYSRLVLPPRPPAVSRRNHYLELSKLTVPEYSRQKTGYNVAILIYQVLQFLRERRLDAVTLRLESLRKYQQRYLRDPSLLRSRTFLRLLLLLPENEFNPDQLIRSARVQQQLTTLRQAPAVTEVATEAEIIPYEHLWELTLRILELGPPR